MERTWHIVLTRLQLASWEGTWIVNTHTHTSQVAEVAAGLEHPTGPVKDSAMLHNSAASVFSLQKSLLQVMPHKNLWILWQEGQSPPWHAAWVLFVDALTAEGSSWDTLKGWHTLTEGLAKEGEQASQHPDGLRAIKLHSKDMANNPLDDHASCFLLGRSNSF